MGKTKASQPKKVRQVDLKRLFKHAKQQFPGIMEILQVYGGYEEMEQAVKQYLAVTQPQPLITTSNQTNP